MCFTHNRPPQAGVSLVAESCWARTIAGTLLHLCVEEMSYRPIAATLYSDNLTRKFNFRAMRTVFIFLAFLLATSSAEAGLDITAFENLTIVKSPTLTSDGIPTAKDQIKFFPSGFPERFQGLESGKIYKFKSNFEFRAGSYSGYNYWRNELAKLAGYEQSPYEFNGKTELRYDATVWRQEKGPFWELINFSDAEGVIGPHVCKKIYKDFVQYSNQAKQHADEYFRESYENWQKAFSMCAHNGAIAFH